MISQYMKDRQERKLGLKEKLPTKKPPVAIPKVSKTRADLNKVYAAQSRQFLKKNPFCQAKLTGCQGAAMDLHHSRGRGKDLLDESTWKALCRNCHSAIENHPEMAKSIGMSASRLAIHDKVEGNKITIIDKI